jgi:hypothetical protein
VRDFLNAVDPVKLETEIGAIHVTPNSGRTATIHGSHLTVNGVSLQVSALLTSSDRLNWDFVHQIDTTTGRFTISGNALTALVDGREADIITLGKIAEAIIPAVRTLAQTNPELFLEAERRHLNNEIAALEADIENRWTKLKEKEDQLAAIENQLRAPAEPVGPHKH